MLGAFYRSKDDLKVMEAEDPRIRDPSDVIVRVRACGVCGTDIKMLRGEYEGTNPPVILGHEFAGEVVAVGENVVNVAVGDTVAVDPNLTCGECFYCRNSQENLCTKMVTTGMNQNGGMAEFCVVNSGTAYRVPASLPFAEAAFAEPLACVLSGVERARVAPGETVGIVGLGPIGLLFARALGRAGAARVIGFEVNPERAATARTLGVTAVIDPTSGSWLEEAKALTGGRGVDVAIDAVAVPAASRTAVDVVRRGGRVVIFGIPPHGAKLELDTERLVKSELEVRGSFIDRFTFPRAISMLAEGSIDVASLVTDVFRLEDAAGAFDAVRNGKGLKVQIHP
jgi:threonine dehydrogenase-like Zn-dependent dehydrogenase